MEINSPNHKEFWTVSNAPVIARFLGYVYSKPFETALFEFIVRAQQVPVPDLLGSVAYNFFHNYKPPLEREKVTT
jgi:hypothetical protein